MHVNISLPHHPHLLFLDRHHRQRSVQTVFNDGWGWVDLLHHAYADAAQLPLERQLCLKDTGFIFLALGYRPTISNSSTPINFGAFRGSRLSTVCHLPSRRKIADITEAPPFIGPTAVAIDSGPSREALRRCYSVQRNIRDALLWQANSLQYLSKSSLSTNYAGSPSVSRRCIAG
jgi:hypothetical protein